MNVKADISKPRTGIQVDRTNVGLVGTGTVGQSVARLIHEEKSRLLSRCKTELDVVAASYRSSRPDNLNGIPEEGLTTDIFDVARDDRVDILVELIGGVEDAYRVITEALDRGKSVVTANKALLFRKGAELVERARENGVSLFFEGAVAGAIPVVSAVQRSFVTEHFQRACCILNGTSNFVLTEMEQGRSYGDALDEAKEKGIAEADPTLDVSGRDAAEKLSLLVSLLFDVPIPDSIHSRGIEDIEQRDLRYARDLGYTPRLLGTAERQDGSLSYGVRPFLIPQDHELAGVRGAENAIFLEGEQIGSSLFTGPGAGGNPTGAVVVSDIVRASRELNDATYNTRLTMAGKCSARDPGDQSFPFYIRFGVVDRVGILSTISGILADHDISISGAWAKDNRDGIVSLVMTTHEAPTRALEEAVSEVDDRDGLTTGDSLFLPIRDLS